MVFAICHSRIFFHLHIFEMDSGQARDPISYVGISGQDGYAVDMKS